MAHFLRHVTLLIVVEKSGLEKLLYHSGSANSLTHAPRQYYGEPLLLQALLKARRLFFTNRRTSVSVLPPLTEQNCRAGFVERADKPPPLSRVGLVGILPQLQAVPQHHVQDQNQHLTRERERMGAGVGRTWRIYWHEGLENSACTHVQRYKVLACNAVVPVVFDSWYHNIDYV